MFFHLSHISPFLSHKAIYFISSKKMCSLHVLCSTLHHSLCLRPCDRDISCFFVPASVSRCYPYSSFWCSHSLSSCPYPFFSLLIPISSYSLLHAVHSHGSRKHVSSSIEPHLLLLFYVPLSLFSGMLILPKAKLLHLFCTSFFHIPFFQLLYYFSYFDIKY